MSGIDDALGYLAGYYSRSEITTYTGIPQSSLSYALRGLRPIPVKYRNAVWKMKNMLAYAELFNAGVPSIQAAQISLDSVGAIQETDSYVKAVADKLTIGYIETVMRESDEDMTDQEYIDKYYSQAYADIIKSLRASTKPIWDWQDYLSPDSDQ